jgi:cyanophycinase
LIALLGAGEYLQVVDPIDRYLLDSLKLEGRKARVVCLPTAAGREGDGTISRWSRMGIDHFERLGAQPVALRIVDRESADDPRHEPVLENADIIYFSGGDPGYLHRTLQGSRAWEAARRAWSHGAIYAGCSAGAMVLAQKLPDLRLGGMNRPSAFGVLPASFILPHYDAMPAVYKPMIAALRLTLGVGEYVIGIDEDTALVGKRGGEWRALGVGKVHVIKRKTQAAYAAGEVVDFTNAATEGTE